MFDTNVYYDDFIGAPRAAQRVAESAFNSAKCESYFRDIPPNMQMGFLSQDGDGLPPARLDGRVALSVELCGKVCDIDLTPQQLGKYAERGIRHIVRHANGDPEGYLRSLFSDTFEVFESKAQVAIDVALAMAMSDPEASEALSGEKEWVSVADIRGEDGVNRVSVASGVCVFLESDPATH